MKIKLHRHHAHALLVVVALIAVVGIGYLGYKIVTRLQEKPIQPVSNQYTNLIDWAWSPRLPQIQEISETIEVTLPEFGLTNVVLPTEALGKHWHFTVQTSTNLSEWEDVELEWADIPEYIQTNHCDARRWFRLALWY